MVPLLKPPPVSLKAFQQTSKTAESAAQPVTTKPLPATVNKIVATGAALSRLFKNG